VPYGDQYADSKVMDYTAGHDAGFAAVCAEREMCPCDTFKDFLSMHANVSSQLSWHAHVLIRLARLIRHLFAFLNLVQGKYWGDIMIQHAA
jgi:hypothetical protein